MRQVMVGGRVSGRIGSAPDPTSWYWILTRNRVSGLEIFTQSTPEGAVILPVFGSAEYARVYLSGRNRDWSPRKTGRGELVSILMGVCREAGWVTLDPPPDVTAQEALRLVGVSRNGFLEPLLGRGRFWFQKEHERRRP